jgi:hypothetical protein
VDDLFKDTTPAPTAPDATAPAEPAPGEQPKAEGVDDLFKETAEPKLDAPAAPAEAAPTDATPEAPAEQPKAEGVDDLFSEPAPGSDKSAAATSPSAMRLWTDNTGKYHVMGRLVMVSQTHVRLLKENGRYTTVPFSRLSQPDIAFVREAWTGSVASW